MPKFPTNPDEEIIEVSMTTIQKIPGGFEIGDSLSLNGKLYKITEDITPKNKTVSKRTFVVKKTKAKIIGEVMFDDHQSLR